MFLLFTYLLTHLYQQGALEKNERGFVTSVKYIVGVGVGMGRIEIGHQGEDDETE